MPCRPGASTGRVFQQPAKPSAHEDETEDEFRLGSSAFTVLFTVLIRQAFLFSFSSRPVASKQFPIIVAGLRTQRGELELSATSATEIGSDDPRFIVGDP
jgi:hypothetical protein